MPCPPPVLSSCSIWIANVFQRQRAGWKMLVYYLIREFDVLWISICGFWNGEIELGTPYCSFQTYWFISFDYFITSLNSFFYSDEIPSIRSVYWLIDLSISLGKCSRRWSSAFRVSITNRNTSSSSTSSPLMITDTNSTTGNFFIKFTWKKKHSKFKKIKRIKISKIIKDNWISNKPLLSLVDDTVDSLCWFAN